MCLIYSLKKCLYTELKREHALDSYPRHNDFMSFNALQMGKTSSINIGAATWRWWSGKQWDH